LFEKQLQEYRDAVFPPAITSRLAVEAGVSQGWERYLGSYGAIISIEDYGASAPGKVVMDAYGFTVENVCKRALELLKKSQEALK
jgi:transketolase